MGNPPLWAARRPSAAPRQPLFPLIGMPMPWDAQAEATISSSSPRSRTTVVEAANPASRRPMATP